MSFIVSNNSDDSPKEIDANAVAFAQALKQAGFVLDAPIEASGEIVRVHVDGDAPQSLNGWYSFHNRFAWYGSWRNHDTGQAWKQWTATPISSLSPEDRAVLEYEQKSLQLELALSKQANYEDGKNRAARLWNAATETAEHPYLQSKGLSKTYGAKVYRDMLLIPMQDLEGNLQTLLRVWPDGTKRLLSGGKKQGGFFAIGTWTQQVYLCEGFATGASIHEATGCCTLCCGDCGNLVEVAKVLKATHPNQTFVVAGDTDSHKPLNAGAKAAKATAEALAADFVLPDFTGVEGSEEASDFNDLARSVGLEEVKKQLEHNRKPSDAKVINGLLAPDALDYRRELKQAAKTLGVSMGDVDKEVSKARARQWAETLSVTPPQPPVDSAALQQDAREVLEHTDPLALVNSAIKELGYGGDTRLPHLLYLSYSSRLLTFDLGNC